jgi:alpha-tubulin suppressor-like RCC1 family protein
MAIKTDGTVWVWGDNTWGQCGCGTPATPATMLYAQQVPGITNAAQTAQAGAGGYVTHYIVTTGGQVYAWGYNGNGQLADGTTSGAANCVANQCNATPTLVSGVSTVTAVSAGFYWVMALRSDGTPYGWGDNGSGQSKANGTIGGNQLTAALLPLHGISQMAAGYSHGTVVSPCSGGSLSATAPGSITFPGVTLNGSNQSATATGAFQVTDTGGTGAGWNIQASETVPTSGSNTLPHLQVTAVSTALGSPTCTGPSSATAYPITLSGTAAKIYSNPVERGEGVQTLTFTMLASVPANAMAATYSNTLTVSVVSGP